MPLSINKEAAKIAREICSNPEKHNVIVERSHTGAYVIDAGIDAEGGFLIGKLIVEICLGGLGTATLSMTHLGDIELPSINVYTDKPAISTLASQMAGWRIKVGDYMAMASGPARALAQKPKGIYEKIGYRDESDEAVIVLETSRKPPEEVIRSIAESCRVPPEKLYIIVAPTRSIACLTQVSGRVVEVGIYRLVEVGFDPKAIIYACGEAPIPPPHPDETESMGRSNDMILYGGSVQVVVDYHNDEYLERIAKEAVSSASRDYGRPFAEIFRGVGGDFYKIDPKVFAPARIVIMNRKTGRVFASGRINVEVLLKSLGLG
ncbi:MAG: methenyltetrahydromethanopterin cyclohydrolase [Candidatus Bathyarchaeia archaeon]|nr:methenyltetrahydromethanopterin cyclohydrolase [Candidatus Bathyarchaeota archaeon]